MHENKTAAVLDQIGFMDHVPRFTFDGGRYVREDHFLSAVRPRPLTDAAKQTLAGLSKPAPGAEALRIATDALKRIALAITGDTVPQVQAGDALDKIAAIEALTPASPHRPADLEQSLGEPATSYWMSIQHGELKVSYTDDSDPVYKWFPVWTRPLAIAVQGNSAPEGSR